MGDTCNMHEKDAKFIQSLGLKTLTEESTWKAYA
jgi:hypothetical protein